MVRLEEAGSGDGLDIHLWLASFDVHSSPLRRARLSGTTSHAWDEHATVLWLEMVLGREYHQGAGLQNIE